MHDELFTGTPLLGKGLGTWSSTINLPDALRLSPEPEDQAIRELAAEVNRLHELINSPTFVSPDKKVRASEVRARVIQHLVKAIEAKRGRKSQVDIIKVLAWLLDLFAEILTKNGLTADQRELIVRDVAHAVEAQNLEEKTLIGALAGETS